MMIFHLLLVAAISIPTSTATDSSEASENPIDPNGYVMYCPCMGKYAPNRAQQSPALTYYPNVATLAQAASATRPTTFWAHSASLIA